MARRWNVAEERLYRAQLYRLYVEQNKTIGEIGRILKLGQSTVFDRLHRLEIPICRDKKEFVNNQRKDIILPGTRSSELAELFGILLGDGHITHFQVFVNLGSKECLYAQYVQTLMRKTFGGHPRICTRAAGHRDVYLGSTKVTSWLFNEGLVRNKVLSQVTGPKWIYENHEFISAFLRGFFDTDGSVYKLRYGIQVSFCNRSMPLLFSLQKMLQKLRYNPSAISGSNLSRSFPSDFTSEKLL